MAVAKNVMIIKKKYSSIFWKYKQFNTNLVNSTLPRTASKKENFHGFFWYSYQMSAIIVNNSCLTGEKYAIFYLYIEYHISLKTKTVEYLINIIANIAF